MNSLHMKPGPVPCEESELVLTQTLPFLFVLAWGGIVWSKEAI